jgi:hypothetical protein
MGLFNHLFGDKKSSEGKLAIEDERRIALWKEHLSNHIEREKLSKHFNRANVDKTLENFETVEAILEKIEALISPELIKINDEEKTDAEILVDLEQLRDNPELDNLSSEIRALGGEQSVLLTIFHEIHKILEAELYLIRLIRKKPENIRDLLLKLFRIIFHQEARLYGIFREEKYFEENRPTHTKIMKMATAIIHGKEVEKMGEEEKLAREIFEQMGPKGKHRKLAEDIFLRLIKIIGAPLRTPEAVMQGINALEDLIKNDEKLYRIIKKLRPKYDDNMFKAVILAFREAYKAGYLEDLEQELNG